MKKILVFLLLFICSFNYAQTKRVNINAACVTFNKLYNKAFVAVLADDSLYSNSLLQLDPYSGTVEKHLPLSGEARSMELTPDNKHLYICFQSLQQILKIDLETFQIAETIDIGNYVTDFAISPVNENVLLVIRGGGEDPVDLVMFKEGILQPKQVSAGLEFPSEICVKNDGTMLYAHNGISSGSEGFLMNIVDDGIEFNGVIWDYMIPSFGDIKIHNDLIYDRFGTVLDAFSDSIPIIKARMPVYKIIDEWCTGAEYSEIHGCYVFGHVYLFNAYISFFHGQYFNYLGSIDLKVTSDVIRDVDVVDENNFILIGYDSNVYRNFLIFHNNSSKNRIFLKSKTNNSEPATNKWSDK